MYMYVHLHVLWVMCDDLYQLWQKKTNKKNVYWSSGTTGSSFRVYMYSVYTLSTHDTVYPVLWYYMYMYLAVRNLGVWVIHLIQNMEEVCLSIFMTAAWFSVACLSYKSVSILWCEQFDIFYCAFVLPLCFALQIYAKTKDDHFVLVVVDYDSQDMNVKKKLKNSSINRYLHAGSELLLEGKPLADNQFSIYCMVTPQIIAI